MPPIKGRRKKQANEANKGSSSASTSATNNNKSVRWRDRFAVKATIFTAEQIAIMQVVDGLNNILHIDEGSSNVGNAIENGANYLQSKFIDFDPKTEKYEDGLLNDVLEFFGDEDFDEGLSDVTYMVTYAGVYIVENALLKRLKGGYSKGKEYLGSTKSKAEKGYKRNVDKAKDMADSASSSTINLAIDVAVRLAHGSKYLRVNTKFLINKLKKKGSISKKDLEDATGKVFNKEQTKRFYDFVSKLKTKSKADRTNKDNIFNNATTENMSKHTQKSGSSPFSRLASGKGLAIAGSSTSVSFGLYTLVNHIIGGSVEENMEIVLDELFACMQLLYSISSRLKVLQSTPNLNQSHVSFDIGEGDKDGARQLMMRLINTLVDNIIAVGSDKFLHFLDPLKLMLTILDDVLKGKSSKYMLHHNDVTIFTDIINASLDKVKLDNDATFSRTLGVLPLGLPNIKSYIHFLADNTTDNIGQFLKKFTHYNSQFPMHQDEIENEVAKTTPEQPEKVNPNSSQASLVIQEDSVENLSDEQILTLAMMNSPFDSTADKPVGAKPKAVKKITEAIVDRENDNILLNDADAAKLSVQLQGALI